MAEEMKPCPECGALPCDWVDNPHTPPTDEQAEALIEALRPFVDGYQHTATFLRSREKMHPAGQELYAEDVARARAALEAVGSMK